MLNQASRRSVPKLLFCTMVPAILVFLACGQTFAQSTTSTTLASTASLDPKVIADSEANKTEHHIRQYDYSGSLATSLFGGKHAGSTATIDIYMPDTWLWNQARYAKNEFLPFKPSQLDLSDTLKVIAAGMTVAGPACESPDRIALLSGESGDVVAEAVSSQEIGYIFQNGLGAKAKCANLLAAFSMSDLERIRTAAKNGRFIIAVFYKDGGRKLYQIKQGDQNKLGLPESKANDASAGG